MTINATKLWLYTPDRIIHEILPTSTPIFISNKNQTASLTPKAYFINLEESKDD